MKYDNSIGSKIFDIVNYFLLALFAAATLFPFLNLLTISLSTAEETSRLGLHLFPKEIVFEAYRKVFSANYIWKGYVNTVYVTIGGTFLTMIFSIFAAYPLSKKYLMNRSFWTGFVVITMFLSGGLIPTYLNIRNLGLIDNRLALVLPPLINTYNMLILRNYFMSLPDSLEESARIDGANDILILFKIILPLSMPILATVALWTGVALWNSWFECLLYIRNPDKFVLQVVLRRIILDGSSEFMNFETTDLASTSQPATESIKAATVLVAVIPIMMVYPFIQKYFVKGVMVGSLKG